LTIEIIAAFFSMPTISHININYQIFRICFWN